MMIRKAASRLVMTLGTIAIGTLSAVHAQEAKVGYSLTPFGTGFILLNRETGTVSQCRQEEGAETLTCELASDDRKNLEDRIKLLEDKLAEKASPAPQVGKAPDPAGAREPAKVAEPAPARPATLVAETTTPTTPPAPTPETPKPVAALDPKSPAGRSLSAQLATIGTEALSRLFALTDDLKAKL